MTESPEDARLRACAGLVRIGCSANGEGLHAALLELLAWRAMDDARPEDRPDLLREARERRRETDKWL